MVEKSSRDLFDFPCLIIARALDIVSRGKIMTSLFVHHHNVLIVS